MHNSIALLRFATLALTLSSACLGASEPTPGAEPGGKQAFKPASFQLTSSAFKQGAYIPVKYTEDGADVSPPLKWTGAPETAKAFALICDDPDAPAGTWVHWVVYAIPSATHELAEAAPKLDHLPGGLKQGVNSFGAVGYGGPAPPKGSDHRYYFKLYALDTALPLDARATKADLEKQMKGHVLAHTQLMGRYKR